MNRGWARILLVVETSVAVLAALGVLGGLAMIVLDLADDSDAEKFDGLGAFLGLLLLLTALLVLVVAVVLAVLTRSTLRTGRPGPRVAGGVPAAVAVLWLLGAVWAAVGGAEAPGVALAVLAGLVLLVPAVGTMASRHPTV